MSTRCASRRSSIKRAASATTRRASPSCSARALGLWRGTAARWRPDTELIGALRARLDELRQAAVEDLVDAELALGQHRRLAPELEALVAEEPLRERRWGQLIRALYGSGRQADALAGLPTGPRDADREIGVEPSAELRQLEAAVLAQDESLLGAAGPAVADGAGRRRVPSTGERPPSGRRRASAARTTSTRCVQLVEQHRLVTLTGPGGVGKTRLALELCGRDAGRRARRRVVGRARRGAQRGRRRWRRCSARCAWMPSAAPTRGRARRPRRRARRPEPPCSCSTTASTSSSRSAGRRGPARPLRQSARRRDEPRRPRHPGEAALRRRPADTGRGGGALRGARRGRRSSTSRRRRRHDRTDLRAPRPPAAGARAGGGAGPAPAPRRDPRAADRPVRRCCRDGSRTAQPHQRNLRAVADWSYELLDEPERIVFERLSVFADGATLDAATSVCAGPRCRRPTTSSGLLDRLDRQVARSSPTVRAPRRGSACCRRSPTTPVSASTPGRSGRGARARMPRGCATSPTRCEFGARDDRRDRRRGAGRGRRHPRRHHLGARRRPVLALEICDDLSPFWFGTMRVSVGWELLSAALDAAGADDPSVRASALAWASVFTTMVQDIEMAGRLADEALAFERDLGDPARLGRICFARALAAGYRSDRDAARWVEEARRHFTAAGSPLGLGHVSFAEGAVRLLDGDLDAAAASLRDAITDVPARARPPRADPGREPAGRAGVAARRPRAVRRDARRAARARPCEPLARRDHRSHRPTGARPPRAGRPRRGAAPRRTALAASGESFMPVVNGYAFKTAGLVNLQSGHVAEGRAQLRAAIEAFEQGTGSLGVGQAAMCWVDLSRSYGETGEVDEARTPPRPRSSSAASPATPGSASRPRPISRRSSRSTCHGEHRCRSRCMSQIVSIPLLLSVWISPGTLFVTPTVERDVLQFLASAGASFTPPQVHALIGRHSVSGIRKALARLKDVGIVRAERVGRPSTTGSIATISRRRTSSPSQTFAQNCSPTPNYCSNSGPHRASSPRSSARQRRAACGAEAISMCWSSGPRRDHEDEA